MFFNRKRKEKKQEVLSWDAINEKIVETGVWVDKLIEESKKEREILAKACEDLIESCDKLIELNNERRNNNGVL